MSATGVTSGNVGSWMLLLLFFVVVCLFVFVAVFVLLLFLSLLMFMSLVIFFSLLSFLFILLEECYLVRAAVIINIQRYMLPK